MDALKYLCVSKLCISGILVPHFVPGNLARARSERRPHEFCVRKAEARRTRASPAILRTRILRAQDPNAGRSLAQESREPRSRTRARAQKKSRVQCTRLRDQQPINKISGCPLVRLLRLASFRRGDSGRRDSCRSLGRRRVMRGCSKECLRWSRRCSARRSARLRRRSRG